MKYEIWCAFRKDSAASINYGEDFIHFFEPVNLRNSVKFALILEVAHEDDGK